MAILNDVTRHILLPHKIDLFTSLEQITDLLSFYLLLLLFFFF
jgi:hypothetical protein